MQAQVTSAAQPTITYQSKLGTMYQKYPAVKKIVDNLAERQRFHKVISAQQMMHWSRESVDDVLQVFELFNILGMGESKALTKDKSSTRFLFNRDWRDVFRSVKEVAAAVDAVQRVDERKVVQMPRSTNGHTKAPESPKKVEIPAPLPDDYDPPLSEGESLHGVYHTYRLRHTFMAHFNLPKTLTPGEARRLADFILTLPIDGKE